MADLTREEVAARLEAVEARVDARLVGIEGKIDLMTDRLAQFGNNVSESMRELRGDYKGTRLTIIVTAIASVLAIVGILLASQQNMLSAFQTGLSAVSTVHPPSEATGNPPPQDTE